MSKPVLLFSGGLDSTTLLWRMKPEVKCLLFDYGQRHGRELDAAVGICKSQEVEYRLVDLNSTEFGGVTPVSQLIQSGSQSGFEPVPEGYYTEPTMKTTIVPNRNMIMISIAVGWAVATKSQEVLWAAHAGDHAIYPDCRVGFLQALRQAIYLGNEWSPVTLSAPFIDKTKGDIVKMGLEMGVPYEKTWSCYKGLDKPCGKCGTCVERLEAFHLNNVGDPLVYEVPA